MLSEQQNDWQVCLTRGFITDSRFVMLMFTLASAVAGTEWAEFGFLRQSTWIDPPFCRREAVLLRG